MQSIIEFMLECFAFGSSSKRERRNMYGCVVMVLGAFLVFCVVVIAAAWILLKP